MECFYLVTMTLLVNNFFYQYGNICLPPWSTIIHFTYLILKEVQVVPQFNVVYIEGSVNYGCINLNVFTAYSNILFS
jgi:hypothetical protein